MRLPRLLIKIFSLCFLFGISSLALRGSVFAGYGGSASPPVCHADAPGTPWLYYTAAVSDKEVKLAWYKADKATSWTIAYGVEPGRYIYGLSNFGNRETGEWFIGDLPAGTYYFVVRANHDCKPGAFSGEKKVIVGKKKITTPIVKIVKREETPDLPKETVAPTPAGGKKLVPPVKAAGQKVTPTPEAKGIKPTATPFRVTPIVPQTPTPTPAPVKKNFIERFFDFLGGIFG